MQRDNVIAARRNFGLVPLLAPEIQGEQTENRRQRWPSLELRREASLSVAWIEYGNLDFGKGTGELELQVEKDIFSLNGDVTDRLRPAKPFVFGMNKH